jgi:hypothetical protein
MRSFISKSFCSASLDLNHDPLSSAEAFFAVFKFYTRAVQEWEIPLFP